ncbi:TIGR04219 family outer membrane beta-barrel protein [Vibrio sp. S9_S30]|uniref:TIGR04219 family outer membrane beta-barrel protein n=1 Tax=Vibrio sp. S9_S30 TaxID=2720226 RepID=UPI001680755C|nr:TIGR04219 family outer membrane beta-barrel protein [Vibrio sp. S9_S30]MBD1557657.1 TIGR04219 family outer membrane beta-barrel protein [Vibrio sp. S9_S30]
MKNRVCAALFSSLLMCTFSSYAETDLSVTVSGDAWSVKTAYKHGTETMLNSERETQFTGSLALEHDIAYTPNVRIRFSPVEMSYIEFNKTDFTFYYDLIDHELLHFDAGITLSQYSNGVYSNPADPTQDFNKLLFSWYANAVITVPETNVDLIGEFDFGNSDGDKTADVTAGMRYRFDLEKLDVAVRAGYRVMDYRFKMFSGPSDMYLTHGVFVGVEASF